MMNFIERKIMPAAAKIGNQRHLLAIRDALIGMLAITMIGSFAVLINNLGGAIPGYDKLMISLFGKTYKTLGGDIWWGTFAFMTVFLVVGIAYKLAKSYGDDGFEAMLVALASYFVLVPQTAKIEGVKDGVWGLLGVSYTNSTALFTGIVVSIIATEIFVRLAKVKYLVIRLPEGVPPAVSRSFARLFPGMITIFLIGLIGLLFRHATGGEYFNDWLNNVLVTPLTGAADSLGFAVLITTIIQFFWALGLHGSNIVAGITGPLLTNLGNANIDLFAKGVTDLDQYHILAGPFLDVYVNLGGSGATIGLLIGLLIASKKRKQMVALGMPPALFQINEPVIFGMPIVLNPIWIIPFVITPAIMTVTAYLATAWGWVYPVVANVPWVTPPIIGGYLATGGHISGAIMAAVNFAICIVAYFPFVMIQERMDQKKLNEVLKEQQENTVNIS